MSECSEDCAAKVEESVSRTASTVLGDSIVSTTDSVVALYDMREQAEDPVQELQEAEVDAWSPATPAMDY